VINVLLEAIDFLAREIIIDKSIERIITRAEKLRPGAGAALTRVYVGASLGNIVGTQAGKSAKKTIDRGGAITVFAGTPEIDKYDRSAIGSTRVI
tara:strand:- start:1527 stop:1811 length:285 start_codon:yes stop_codon:yes gene_type:complete